MQNDVNNLNCEAFLVFIFCLHASISQPYSSSLNIILIAPVSELFSPSCYTTFIAVLHYQSLSHFSNVLRLAGELQ